MISLREHIELSNFHNKENEKNSKQDSKFFSAIKKYKKTPYVYEIDGVKYVFSVYFNDEDKFDEPYFPREWDKDLDDTFDGVNKVKVGTKGRFVSCFCNVQDGNENYKDGEPRVGDFIYDADSDDMLYRDVTRFKGDSKKLLPVWFKKAISKIIALVNPSSEYVK